VTGRDTSALTGWALSAIQTALGGRRGRWWGCWWGRSRPTIAAMTTRRAAARAVGVAHAAGSLREMSRGQGRGQGLGQGRGQGGRRIVAGWPRAAGQLAGQPDRGSCPACTRMNSPSRPGQPRVAGPLCRCSPRFSSPAHPDAAPAAAGGPSGNRGADAARRARGQPCRARGHRAATPPRDPARVRLPSDGRQTPCGTVPGLHRDVRRHGRRRRVAHR